MYVIRNSTYHSGTTVSSARVLNSSQESLIMYVTQCGGKQFLLNACHLLNCSFFLNSLNGLFRSIPSLNTSVRRHFDRGVLIEHIFVVQIPFVNYEAAFTTHQQISIS